MRKSTLFLIFMTLCTIMFVALVMDADRRRVQSEAVMASNVKLAQRLMLTDLCLFTEARYTRNPAMTDIHSPFQDHPLAMDHFPSGSLVSPPSFRSDQP